MNKNHQKAGVGLTNFIAVYDRNNIQPNQDRAVRDCFKFELYHWVSGHNLHLKSTQYFPTLQTAQEIHEDAS